MLDHVFLFDPGAAYVAQMLQTLVEFPQRQKPASFGIEQVLAKLKAGVPDHVSRRNAPGTGSLSGLPAAISSEAGRWAARIGPIVGISTSVERRRDVEREPAAVDAVEARSHTRAAARRLRRTSSRASRLSLPAGSPRRSSSRSSRLVNEAPVGRVLAQQLPQDPARVRP